MGHVAGCCTRAATRSRQQPVRHSPFLTLENHSNGHQHSRFNPNSGTVPSNSVEMHESTSARLPIERHTAYDLRLRPPGSNDPRDINIAEDAATALGEPMLLDVDEERLFAGREATGHGSSSQRPTSSSKSCSATSPWRPTTKRTEVDGYVSPPLTTNPRAPRIRLIRAGHVNAPAPLLGRHTAGHLTQAGGGTCWVQRDTKPTDEPPSPINAPVVAHTAACDRTASRSRTTGLLRLRAAFMTPLPSGAHLGHKTSLLALRGTD